MLAMVLLNGMKMKREQAMRKRAAKKAEIEREYCRTCLNTTDLVSIFYSSETKDKRSKELKLVTGLEITMNDGLSQKICSNCVDTINMVMQFRRVSKKAQKALQKMLSVAEVRKSNSLQKPLKFPKQKTKLVKSNDYKQEVDVLQTEAMKPGECKVEDETDKQLEVNFYYDDYTGDDFQNDDSSNELLVEVGQKVVTEVERKVKVKPTPVRRRAPYVPNASSYKCNTCNKEFRMKATYKAHMRFHTNYCVCESCGKRCRNHNQLQEHKRARHGLGKIHKCAYCEYSSATKEALTIHERRHTGERPYICDHCGASFHRRSNLVQHIAIHLTEKNFQCDLCPKREKSSKLLMIHRYKAHRQNKKYRYLCGVCGASFSRPFSVKQHLTRYHRLAVGDQPNVLRVEVNSSAQECQELAAEDYTFVVENQS